jgi:hypothetical protein
LAGIAYAEKHAYGKASSDFRFVINLFPGTPAAEYPQHRGAAESHAKAERAIRTVLAEHLNAHPASRPGARVRVARVSDRGKTRVSVVGVAALVGAKRSDAKARASRANGRLGGRPPKNAITRTSRTKASR